MKDEKLVTIYFVRHGLSCANIINYKYKKSNEILKYLHALIKDPLLSQTGRENCEEIRKKHPNILKKLKNVDFICSSSLLRAIETAWFMLGGKKSNNGGKKSNNIKIHPIPWIPEKGFGKDNVSYNKEEQKQIFSNNYKKDNNNLNPNKNISWKYMYDKTKDGKIIKSSRTTPDYNKFIKFITKTFLDSSKMKNKKHITLTVFSHSNFLRKNIPNWVHKYGEKHHINNNQIIKQDYYYNEKTHTLTPKISKTICPIDVCKGFRGYDHKKNKNIKLNDPRCYENSPKFLQNIFR